MVAFRAGLGAPAARDRAAVAWVADVFRVAAFFVVVFVAGARPPVALPAGAVFAAVLFAAGAFFATAVFFAAVALAVGRRVGLAVAETAFFRAVRAEVAAAVPAVAFLLVDLPAALLVADLLVAALLVAALPVVFVAAAVPGDRLVAGLLRLVAVRDDAAVAAPVFFLIAAWAIVAPRVCRGRSGLPGVGMVERTPPAARAHLGRVRAVRVHARAGSRCAGGEDDHVVGVLAACRIEPAAAGDQP
ncbi:hypothetical protein [Verrucosispora sp. NA02020]|uniref:hypothetical protein n=1 Tax=Verrucosispora sp. NA02020 TaxID=2742132 RepID=UPI003D747AD8